MKFVPDPTQRYRFVGHNALSAYDMDAGVDPRVALEVAHQAERSLARTADATGYFASLWLGEVRVWAIESPMRPPGERGTPEGGA